MSNSVSARIRIAALCTAMSLAAALPLVAQTSGNGNITGTITDLGGAAVAGATVVVTNTDTGVSRTLTADGAGLYAAPFLLPGHYSVSATAASFGKVEHKDILLTVGQIITIDEKLPAASATTTVEVTSETPILDTQKTEVSQTFDAQLLTNLPVATRNWSAFVLSTPNVVQDGGSGLVSFHGISGLYNQNYVDGSNNNQMLFSEARGRSSGAPYVYSIDSIKEFQAETSNYSVEFGQAAGGQVNAITKSGTNAIHGDLFWLFRYPDLNALDPYSKYIAKFNPPTPAAGAFLLTQPVHQQNQFGGSVGGPIIKDRLFYFFTYDGFRKVGRVLYSDSNTISTTPVLAANPLNSYALNNTASPAQCPIVGNTQYGYNGTTGITATQCLSAITFLQGVSTAAPGRFQKQNLFFPRLDWHINSKNDAFVDYNFVDYDSSYGYSPANTFSNSSPSTNAPTSYHERFLVAGLTTQIGKASVNQIHFQYGRDLETAGANAPGPSVGTGIATFGMPNALPRIAEPDEKRTQFTDVFSTTRGHHTFKFGGDYNNVHEVMINLFQGGGIYSYSGTNNNANFQSYVQDAFAGQAGNTDPYAGYHYTSFVQTVDVINTKAGTQGKDDFYMNLIDGFAEDTWKVAPTLTLTAGVRYDIQITPAPQYTTPSASLLASIPNSAAVYGGDFAKYSQTIKNTSRVQPRFGFSWQPFNGSVVRGGYGIFSALNQGSTYYADRVENGVVQINYNYTGCGATSGATTVSCTAVPGTGGTAAKLAFPNVPFQTTGPSIAGSLHPVGGTPTTVNGPSVTGPPSFHGLDPNFVPPYAHEMDLSVEQALPGKMSMSVGYVATRGMRLPVFIDANLLGKTPSGLRTYNVQDINNNVTQQLTVPVYRPTDRINTAIATYNVGFSKANTWYNSLAATVRRPFSNGLEVILNYTWAHGSDTGQVGGANGTFYGGNAPLDPNNQKAENGLSDTDIRNRFTMSFVYQPHFFESNKWFKHAVDDWTFSGTEIASGGQPLFLGMSGTVYSGSTSSSSYGADGNIFGGAMSSGSGLPSTGRPPQVGRNSIIGLGYNDFDFRLSRNIPIHDKIYMQFSGNAYNLLNHTIVTGQASSLSTYLSYSATTLATSAGTVTVSCPLTPVPTGSALQGCITPNPNLTSGSVSQRLNAFGAISGTNNGLFSARQLEVSAKLFF
jgi:phage baseplate assembly protein gpV